MTTDPSTAPRPEHRPHVHTEHGVSRPDPFAWMRDRDDPAVLAHRRAENAHTEAATTHLAGFRKALFDEMLGRIREDDTSVPVRHRGWLTWRRTHAGRPYPTWMRRRDAEGASDEVVLDVNALAEGEDYLQLGALAISPDHRILAYSTDTTGRERFTLRFRDLSTGEDLDEVVEDVSYGATWAMDSRTILYARHDDTLRPDRILRHVLGTDPADDALVYAEPDPRFRVGVGRTRSDRWLVIHTGSSKTDEVHLVPADAPDTPPVVFAPRVEGEEYDVAHQGDRWLVRTNRDAPTFRVLTAPEGHTDRSHWTELVPARDDTTVVDVDAFATHTVVTERADGLEHLRILARDGNEDTRLAMPDATWVLQDAANPDFHARTLRFGYTSLVRPASVFEHDLDSGARTLRKQQPVEGGYDPDAYVAEHLRIPAADGTSIPVSLVRRADVDPAGAQPTLLYGYGAYGLTIEPAFRSTRLSLLDRGVVFVIAHVRGGGYLGRPWYEAGKLAHKPNTFSDFLDVAQALVDRGRTTPTQLVCMGGSAGGLLIGNVIQQRPDLFHAAVAQVPFVDVLSTMLDDTIPLTTNEWEEWGNPAERAVFDRLRAYSPYDMVADRPLPHLLVTSGLHDPRVQYWEPAKWVARLREHAKGDPQILHKIELGAGHGGKSGRYGALEDTAFVFSWILDRLGLAETPE